MSNLLDENSGMLVVGEIGYEQEFISLCILYFRI